MAYSGEHEEDTVSDIRVLIVVDGIFSLTTTYPIDPTLPPFAPESDPNFGPDAWFTLSHLISTLRNSPSPTFTVDTASRGFNAAGNFPDNITNTAPDPDATIAGPFHFDDPSINLSDYDEIWLFGDEGYDVSPVGPLDPTTGEPGGLTDSELAAITKFMQAGGGLFAVGDHDGLGSGMSGRIPRLRYMRKWYSPSDTSQKIPPLAVTNWPGGGTTRQDTLQKGATDVGDTFFFDDQSDDIPQPLNVLVPSHPAIQGATGVLTIYPDHMHEGEVMVPSGARLTQTPATDPTLSFADPGFTEFPTIGVHQEAPKILTQSYAGTSGSLMGHVTVVPSGTNPEDIACENKNFSSDMSTCGVRTNNTLAAYDGATVNVGRILTDSSFHHFLDLNLLGDPCSSILAKQQGFNASTTGKAYLKEISTFYVNMATWLAWTERKFYFVMGKNNYGFNEVTENSTYPTAFYLFLEGRTPGVVGASPTITFSGSFNSTNIPGLQFTGPKITYDVGGTGASANVTQRIRYEYGIKFNGPLVNDPFPVPGGPPAPFTLQATINIQGQAVQSPPAEFFLLGGEDPFFTNINDRAGNVPYLSQDLRVFTITPTMDNQTFAGLPVPFTFQGGNPATLDTAAGYTYVQHVITWLNSYYGYLNSGFTPPDTNISDPLDTLLPEQNGALNGDSSATPFTGPNVNYNYAIARVRMKSSPGSTPAKNVKVFFRLFTTQTFDTDFINSATATTSADPNVTYPSNGSLLDPSNPLPGTDGGGAVNGCSLPFFATENFDNTPTDYNNSMQANSHQIPGGEDTWAFYGCFLNVNDATNEFGDPASSFGRHPVQHWLAGSAHNCLVAQIAYKLAPIENAGGVIENPGNSDKLAQRNLQVTTSGNPGFPATHRVPQTIDVRPSPPAQSASGRSILSYPDEMMIDWGRTPAGSVASIYWPEVNAASVVKLAQQLYPAQTLTVADAHTIQCTVESPVTYIPIPSGTGGSYAGLMTIDLPPSVRYGNEFDVLVRRITTKQVPNQKSPNDRSVRLADSVDDATVGDQPLWRYVSGSFLARVSVQRETTILPADENLLAILKWRLTLIEAENRWYPVLLRYISYLSARIVGMGGDPSKIPPSPHGYQLPSPIVGKEHGERCHAGKVIGIRYDRFGDFDGFTLLSEDGREHSFRGREHQVEELVRRAWVERTLISVFIESHDSDWPASIVFEQWK
jgi:hypothetical protein